MKKRLFFHALMLIISLPFFGVKVVGQAPEISFRHLSTVDGLSNFTVLSIVQDRQGFMWFGTMDGLNRYDGQTIRIYREQLDDTTSLGNNTIHSLACSSDSGMWVGTKKGLYYYNYYQDNFRPITLLDSAGQEVKNVLIRNLLVDGRWLWVGTSIGLYRYDLVADTAAPFNRSDSINQVIIGQTFALKKTHDGVLWIGGSLGLFRYVEGHFSQVNMPDDNPPLRVLSLTEDANGWLWIGTNDTNSGIYILNPKNNEVKTISKESGHLSHNKVNKLFRLDDGSIWAGTTWGLSIINENTLQTRMLLYDKMEPDGLSQNSIKSFFQDRDGLIWIGTFSGGVNYFDPRSQKIRHFSQKVDDSNSLSFDIVAFIYEDHVRNLWIGTEYGGVNVYDPKRKSFRVYRKNDRPDGLINDNIKSILQGPQGRMFIATQFGLSIFNPKTQKFMNFGKSPTLWGTLGWTPLHDLCLDDQGNVWLGSTGKYAHLSKFDTHQDTLIHFLPPKTSFPVLEKPETISMVFDSTRGIFWSGGDNGLFAFDTRQEKYLEDTAFYPVVNRLHQVGINDILLDKNKLLWIATFGQGLFVLDTRKYELRRVGKADGLEESSFYALIDDRDGNLWVSANANLYKIHMPERILDPITNIEKFGVQEGFPPQQYFRSAANKDHLGNLYFGGDQGFVSFDPSVVKNIVFHPKVIIADILANDKSLQVSHGRAKTKYRAATQQGVTLTYQQSSFLVQFIAPNYINQDNTWYQYRLLNEHASWQDLGHSQTINFTKLKAGDYDLQIRATSDKGNFGDGFTSYHITVKPPYWATVWAYLFYLLVIVLMLYLFFMITRRWERLNQSLKFEHLQREQEKSFSQQRLKFFTDISHELRTPLTLILAPLKKIIATNYGNAKIKNQLMLMLRNGERMLQLINQLLDLRKMETGNVKLQAAEGNIVNFIKEVSLPFREEAQSRDIQFDVHASQEQVHVWFDRDKFEVVLYNLFSNALKYTPNHGKIGISVKDQASAADGNEAQIVIENTGKGIEPDQVPQIFNRYYSGSNEPLSGRRSSGVGLEIVRNIIDLHKGEIDVYSDYDDKGVKGMTRFVIHLKKGKAHLTADELSKNYRNSEDVKNYVSSGVHMPSASEKPWISEDYLPQKVDSGKPTFSILIAEDNPDVRQLVTSIFEDQFTVMLAANGAEACKTAAEKLPDLIISDIMMPEMDGIALCRKIKSDIATSHIPVILLTARTAVTFKYEGLETGADDYITKPFDVDDLRLRAINIMQQRKKLKEKFGKSKLLLPEEISLTSIDEKLLQHAIDFISEHIEESTLTIERIAKNAGMSRTNYYRKIRALTGLTPAEFLRKVRMDRAAALLKTNKFRVSEVRQMVGISDADYFRSCFKKAFGATPREFFDKEQKGV